MIYAYLRVSTDDQTTENQRSLIESKGYKIDQYFVDEATHGTTDWKSRKIKTAIRKSAAGDVIVVAELSRLGRSLKQILEMVEICRKKNVSIIAIREGIELNDDNPITKLLISILGSLAEMERNLISQRTKDALARRKADGVVLGRPVGSGGYDYLKLAGKEDAIRALLEANVSKSKIAKVFKVHRMTLISFVKRTMPEHIGAYPEHLVTVGSDKEGS